MNLRNVNLLNVNLRNVNPQGADLLGANLRNVNLRNVNPQRADLRDVNLKGANLQGADMDFSCLPLWCGALGIKIDKRLFCQLLYHAIHVGLSVEDESVQKLLNSNEALELVNQSHRAEECGKIHKTN